MSIFNLNSANPTIALPSWIAPSAIVIGNVTIRQNASVWFNVVVRGDNEPIVISDSVNVQDGSVLHSDPGFPLTISDNTSVGHSVILHGCSVGRYCIIGMGSVVMNGAHIGDQSIVGANALITEGKSFPPRSLIVGSPARRIRELTDVEVSSISENAQHYVDNSDRYKRFLSATAS